MNEETIRPILRLMAVATILVGTILSLQALLAQSALRNTIKEAPRGTHIQATNLMHDLSTYGILAQAVPLALGIALYLPAPHLARHVAK